jgi:hypothetical protein
MSMAGSGLSASRQPASGKAIAIVHSGPTPRQYAANPIFSNKPILYCRLIEGWID